MRAFWWPFSTGEGAEMEIETEAVRREPVAFEMASAEQKFLAEAQHYMGLSPLEACQQEVRSGRVYKCDDVTGSYSVWLCRWLAG